LGKGVRGSSPRPSYFYGGDRMDVVNMGIKSTYCSFKLGENLREFKKWLKKAKHVIIQPHKSFYFDTIHIAFKIVDENDNEEVFVFDATSVEHDFYIHLFWLEITNLRTFMKLCKPNDEISMEIWQNNNCDLLRERGLTMQTIIFNNKRGGTEVRINLIGRLDEVFLSSVKIYDKYVNEPTSSDLRDRASICLKRC